MSIFCYKKLTRPIKLGEVFKKARQEKKWTLPAVALSSRIPQKYLVAMENGDYDTLPKARIYRLSYLRQYARLLELDEKILSKQFIKDGGLNGVSDPTIPQKKSHANASWSISLLAKNLALGACVIFFCGYLFLQIKGILEPPMLTVYTPSEGYVASEMVVMVQGQTDKECHLTINGESIRISESGNFNPKINLTPGVNTIVISATKKHGKTTTLLRHVVVKNNSISFSPTDIVPVD